MLYMRINEVGEVVEVASEMPEALKSCPGAWARGRDGAFGQGWLNRNDIECFEMAGDMAKSASKNLGKVYLAIDSGPNVSPRYDVFEAPKVGDDVSKAFNGDYYPVGKVVKIGKDYKRIYVSDASPSAGACKAPEVFVRRKLSGAFVNKGWSLVPGVRNERNPSF